MHGFSGIETSGHFLANVSLTITVGALEATAPAAGVAAGVVTTAGSHAARVAATVTRQPIRPIVRLITFLRDSD
jgi:hypothetical protein